MVEIKKLATRLRSKSLDSASSLGHYSIRVPRDTSVWGVHRWCSVSVSQLKAIRGEAKMYHQVRLWESGTLGVNLGLAYPQNSAEPWAVITDEIPSLQTFWQYGLRFRVEEFIFR